MKSTAAANPVLRDPNTPFGLPPFDEIEPMHFGPAFDNALRRHRVEIQRIATNKARPTFKNTIPALEASGRQLDRVQRVFWCLTAAHTNDELQAIEREMAPTLAQHWNEIASNESLFARIDALMQARDGLRLGAEERRVLERTHLAFIRAGAKLAAEQKRRMGEIARRLAALGTQFSQNVLADEKTYMLPLRSEDDLVGLPDFVVSAAARAAEERASTAPYVITLSRSLIESFLSFSGRRDLREQAFKAWIRRGENGGANDNRAIVAEILKLRRERAQLLGYETFADYKLDDSMAKTPANVRELLQKVWAPAAARAASERDQLQAIAQREGANLAIEPWDWRYYAEKLRRTELDLDEAAIKPYLPLDRVIEAAFYAARRLFHLQFTERHDLKLYHPEVRAFEVTNGEGQHIGLFLGDYFARPSKRSGAWMSALRRQERLAGNLRPIIVNVMNFAKGAAGAPALLSFDDARTLFHEFGHALHGLLSDVSYPSLSGTSVARDFVELPSQLYEHWLSTPEILERFARHYQTGEPMPRTMVEKVSAARSFNQGFATIEYLASAFADIEFHSAAYEGVEDPLAFEDSVLARIGMPKEIVMRHRTPHFAHVFSSDSYAAGYYSYLWSEVLDADAFAAFQEAGDVFHPETAERLKRFIFAAGGSRKEEEAYQGFRGQLPSVDGLLKQRGLRP